MPVPKDGIVGEEQRASIQQRIRELISEYEGASTKREIDSLLDELERETSYIPCVEETMEDVSLFEHIRLQVGIRCAAEQSENGELLFISMDMSGIQSFIYQMYDRGDVLKNLRARSFYLEILMENMADELLERFGLSRANLLYIGGGRAYLLLPYNQESMGILGQYEREINSWFRENFETGLYLAIGHTICSKNDLYNTPTGSYNRIFRDVSACVSSKKRHRYTCKEIQELNGIEIDVGRECRICHTSSKTVIRTTDDVCAICRGLICLASQIMSRKYFVVTNDSVEGIAIFPQRHLCACDETTYSRLCEEKKVVRTYIKNDVRKDCKSFCVADYSKEGTIAELAMNSKGIEKLGVVRGDIDNLGHAFVFGFEKERQNIFRAIAFSKSLSLFFKSNINAILAKTQRNVSVVYSGGDDIFLLGSWNDALLSILDIERELKEYSLGALTISAGFGLFDPKFPVSYIADMVGALEDRSKRLPGKNALTLFSTENGNTFHWDEIRKRIFGEKKKAIEDCLGSMTERGTTFLYNILELVQKSDVKLNIARLAYLLGRMAPSNDKSEEYTRYEEFERKLMQWIKFSNHSEEKEQFIMAAQLYIYENRKKDGGEK